MNGSIANSGHVITSVIGAVLSCSIGGYGRGLFHWWLWGGPISLVVMMGTCLDVVGYGGVFFSFAFSVLACHFCHEGFKKVGGNN